MDWFAENLISIVTLAAALIAAAVGLAQVHASSRQFLFSERRDVLNLLRAMLRLYDENEASIEGVCKDKMAPTANCVFLWMTNCRQLEMLQDAIGTEQETRPEAQAAYLRRISELDDAAVAFELIFTGKISRNASEFARHYVEFINLLRKQTLYAASIEKNYASPAIAPENMSAEHKAEMEKLTENKQRALKEGGYHNELQECRNKLCAARMLIDDSSIRKLEKKTRLNRWPFI